MTGKQVGQGVGDNVLTEARNCLSEVHALSTSGSAPLGGAAKEQGPRLLHRSNLGRYNDRRFSQPQTTKKYLVFML